MEGGKVDLPPKKARKGGSILPGRTMPQNLSHTSFNSTSINRVVTAPPTFETRGG